MNNDIELLQRARDALRGYRREMNDWQPCDAERAIDARLTQCDRCGEANPAEIHTCTPQPVGWIYEDDEGRMMFSQMPHPDPLWEPVYRAAQKRNFKFSTIEEAKQSIPATAGQPQLTDDETRFADAFTALLKAGYGKEAETVLKLGKLKEKNG